MGGKKKGGGRLPLTREPRHRDFVNVRITRAAYEDLRAYMERNGDALRTRGVTSVQKAVDHALYLMMHDLSPRPARSAFSL